MTETMRAVYIDGHDGLNSVKVGGMPKPEPGHGEVRVRIAAAGLNRVDLYMANDGNGFRHELPLILGVDGAGVVDALGPGCTARKPGERVAIYPSLFDPMDEFSRRGDQMLSYRRAVVGENIDGCFADYVVMPETHLFPLADTTRFLDAAILPTAYITAWRAVVTQGEVSAADWVLIHGVGGGASMAALQFAAQVCNAKCIVTSSSDEKLEAARAQGALHTINYRTQDVLAEVRRITAKRGVDVVIENVGEQTWDTSLKACTGGGRIMVFGATTGPNPPGDLQRVFIRQLKIIGVTIGNMEEFRTLLDALERKLFTPVFDSVVSLEDVPKGLARMEAGAQTGKIGVAVNPDLGE